MVLSVSALNNLGPDPSSTFSKYGVDFGNVSNASNTLDNLMGNTSKLTGLTGNSFTSTSVNVAPKKMSNGKIVETNPPKPPSNAPLQTPQNGQPTTPRASVGDCRAGTTTGNSNETLHFTCDFTINLKLEVCKTTMLNIAETYSKTFETKALTLIKTEFPFIQNIENLYKTLKGWFDWVMKYVNMVKAFIKCMSDIIGAIVNFVQQLAAIPAVLISQVAGCLGKFKNLLTSAINETVSGIQKDIAAATQPATAQSSVNDASTSVDHYYNQYSDKIGNALGGNTGG